MDRLLEFIKTILETYVVPTRGIKEVYFGELTKTKNNYPIIALIDLGTTTETLTYEQDQDTHTIQVRIGINNMSVVSGATGGDNTKNNPKFELRKIVEERDETAGKVNRPKEDTVLGALRDKVYGNTEYAPFFTQTAVVYDIKDANSPNVTFATFNLQIKGKPYFRSLTLP